MLLHVSILRSSSGGTFCSLLKLYVQKLVILSKVSVMRQHIVLYLLQGGRSIGKFLVGENVPSAEIHHRLQQQYGEECLGRRSVGPQSVLGSCPETCSWTVTYLFSRLIRSAAISPRPYTPSRAMLHPSVTGNWFQYVAVCWSTAQHVTARHSMAQHGTARHSTEQHGTVWPSTWQHGTAPYSTSQHGTALNSTAQ